MKALILRIIHNDTEADDLLQEIFMEIWNQAKNFSAQKGKPLGWMVTLTRRRSIDALRKKQAYARAEERLQTETRAATRWPGCKTRLLRKLASGDTRALIAKVISSLPEAQQQVDRPRIFSGDEPARNRRKYEYTIGHGENPARIRLEKDLRQLEGVER